LLPLDLDEAWIAEMRATLPELPDARKRRFIEAYGLSAYDASVLVAEQDTAAYFEAVAAGRDAKLTANWVLSELFGRLNRAAIPLSQSPVSAAALGGLIDLIADATISGRIAKDVFAEMFETGRDARAIVDEKGLRQVTDAGELEAVVDRVLAENPDRVAEYRGGNARLLGWFMGQIMKASGGKANPKIVNELLRGKLSE